MRGKDRRVQAAEVGDGAVVEARTADRRAPNGKSFRISAEVSEGSVRSVRLTGDFFLEPEDSIFALESALARAPLAANREEARSLIEKALENATLTGVRVDDLVDAILEVKG